MTTLTMRSAGMSDLETYTLASMRASWMVLRTYSTSFSAATMLLGARHRRHIANLYGLVRVADEVVDGAALAATGDPANVMRLLDELERETEAALGCGYSANPIVHAFACTARICGIGSDLTRPFFTSMRADLNQQIYGTRQLEDYVYGSAEVVGLMCLRVFMRGTDLSEQERETLEEGARSLGSAFQKVNFLRDLSSDYLDRGRLYFGIEPESMTDADKDRLVKGIEAELDRARACLPLLPSGARRGVAAAYYLFEQLLESLRSVPMEDLMSARISVSAPRKAASLLRAYVEATA